MKKILLTACLFSFFIAVPFAQAMDHDRSDGRGGYYTNDEKTSAAMAEVDTIIRMVAIPAVTAGAVTMISAATIPEATAEAAITISMATM